MVNWIVLKIQKLSRKSFSPITFSTMAHTLPLNWFTRLLVMENHDKYNVWVLLPYRWFTRK
jgi:hypothetical protein